MLSLLNDKVCIVTGAAQGIGKGIAERFAADGAIVYACDLREGSMDEWAKACSERNNTRVIPMYFDVSDAVAVKNNFMAIFKTEKRIDALVNNAGVVFNKKIGMIVRQETELMFRINVIAVIEMVQLCSRLMARNGGGSIVNIASAIAEKVQVNSPAYVSAKCIFSSFSIWVMPRLFLFSAILLPRLFMVPFSPFLSGALMIDPVTGHGKKTSGSKCNTAVYIFGRRNGFQRISDARIP